MEATNIVHGNRKHVTLSFRAENDLYEQLKQRAYKEHVSTSMLLRIIVQNYLKNERNKGEELADIKMQILSTNKRIDNLSEYVKKLEAQQGKPYE